SHPLHLDRTLVRLGNDALVEDAHAADHQQPQVAHDVIGECLIVDVVAVDVETKSLTLDAAAIGKFDFEVKTSPPVVAGVAHGTIPPEWMRPLCLPARIQENEFFFYLP